MAKASLPGELLALCDRIVPEIPGAATQNPISVVQIWRRVLDNDTEILLRSLAGILSKVGRTHDQVINSKVLDERSKRDALELIAELKAFMQPEKFQRNVLEYKAIFGRERLIIL